LKLPRGWAVFTKAAEELGMTQSAASYQIKVLEELRRAVDPASSIREQARFRRAAELGTSCAHADLALLF